MPWLTNPLALLTKFGFRLSVSRRFRPSRVSSGAKEAQWFVWRAKIGAMRAFDCGLRCCAPAPWPLSPSSLRSPLRVIKTRAKLLARTRSPSMGRRLRLPDMREIMVVVRRPLSAFRGTDRRRSPPTVGRSTSRLLRPRPAIRDIRATATGTSRTWRPSPRRCRRHRQTRRPSSRCWSPARLRQRQPALTSTTARSSSRPGPRRPPRLRRVRRL